MANHEAQGRPSKRTPEKRAKFLEAIADGKSVTSACEIAGFARFVAYDWRKVDPEFAQAWDDAVEAGTDKLEDAAIQRAKNGSDVLTIFLLKARRPEKFKDRVYNEHVGKDGGPIQSEDVSSARDELASRIAAIADRAGARPPSTKLN